MIMKESIKEIAKKNNKISEFAVDYFNRLFSIFNNLDLKKLDKLEIVLKKARLNKNNIFKILNR